MKLEGLVDIKTGNTTIRTSNHITASVIRAIFFTMIADHKLGRYGEYGTEGNQYGVFLPGYYYTTSGVPTRRFYINLGTGGYTPAFSITGLQSPVLNIPSDGMSSNINSGYSTGDPIDVFYTGTLTASALESAFGIQTGTAQAGASTTITLSADASGDDDVYNDKYIVIKSGTGVDQIRKITDYDGTGKVATVDSAWNTNPSTDSVYYVLSLIHI